MKTFIIADPKFYDEQQKELMGCSSFEEMNNAIVQNWNRGVEKEDKVIIMGDMGGGTPEELKALFERLNGDFVVICNEKLNTMYTKPEYENIGIEHIWHTGLFHKVPPHIYLYCIDELSSPHDYDNEYDVIVVDSTNEIDGFIEGHLLSVDAQKWSYSPINTDELFTTWDNMRVFESMDSTETITEGGMDFGD